MICDQNFFCENFDSTSLAFKIIFVLYLRPENLTEFRFFNSSFSDEEPVRPAEPENIYIKPEPAEESGYSPGGDEDEECGYTPAPVEEPKKPYRPGGFFLDDDGDEDDDEEDEEDDFIARVLNSFTYNAIFCRNSKFWALIFVKNSNLE